MTRNPLDHWSALRAYSKGCVIAVAVGGSFIFPALAQTLSPTAYSGSLYGELSSLGTLGGSLSYANAVSGDGSVVVGYTKNTGGNNRAFRWTAAGGLEDLGTLGGLTSTAISVNANGNVVVGAASTLSQNHGFRWSATTGMVDLGTLGGAASSAQGVSGDGAVIVGWANNAGAAIRAIRWTSSDNWLTTNKLDLGTLPGGGSAWARAISADGSVIVGYSGKTGSSSQAVRWTSNDQWVTTIKTDLGSLGGSRSDAYTVSADGGVIAGAAYINATDQRAFRWSSDTGMVNLGRIASDLNSQAWGVSQDGKVVVGWSGASLFTSTRAFRWSAQTGMQTVEEWLRTGGVTVAGDTSKYATATNSDGTVVVGQTQGNEAFIARLSPIGSGMVSVVNVQNSLNSLHRTLANLTTGTDLILHGLHSQPLDYRISAGTYAAWVSGDWGGDALGSRNGSIGLREMGGALAQPWGQLNLGLGQVSTLQSSVSSSSLSTDGRYLFLEVLRHLPEGLWASVSGFAFSGDAVLDRRYLNAGLPAMSTGQPGVRTDALRVHLEWDRAWRLANHFVSPYADLGYSHTTLRAYSESGGGFPARIGGFVRRDTDARIGMRYETVLQPGWKLKGVLEHVHRFRAEMPEVQGEVIGLFGFSLPGFKQKQDWLRLGFGTEYQLGRMTMAVMANTTTAGGFSREAWVSARLSLAF